MGYLCNMPTIGDAATDADGGGADSNDGDSDRIDAPPDVAPDAPADAPSDVVTDAPSE